MIKKLSRVLCTVLAIAAIISIQTPLTFAASAGFTDVPTNAWFYDAVTTCANKGIVSGMGNGRFAPYDNLTYAQFVTMLVNAFYKDEQAQHESANVTKIDAYYDGNTPWWGYYAYFFSAEGLFKDTNGNAKSFGVMNSNVNRYEMAQLVSNILADNDFTVSESDKASALSRITDKAGIPAKYQPAVASAFSLGILNGFEDGSFGGTGVLTRAQACVVMVKLDDVLKNGNSGGGTTDPVDPQPPQPPVTGEKDITVSTKETQYGSGYYVGDNGFATGTLNNGLPITEDNVVALLAKAQKIWPEGTSWTNSGTYNNHWYETAGSVTSNLLLSYPTSPNYACGGFVAMVSDYLFGKTNNPAHLVTDPMKIHAGDIIIIKNNGKLTHAAIAATSAYQSGDYAGRVWLTEGNLNNKIGWPDYEYSAPTSEAYQQLFDQFNPGRVTTWEVWSRYPA